MLPAPQKIIISAHYYIRKKISLINSLTHDAKNKLSYLKKRVSLLVINSSHNKLVPLYVVFLKAVILSLKIIMPYGNTDYNGYFTGTPQRIFYIILFYKEL